MKEKKKPNKKSIEYVRPQLGKFNLLAFPGVEFSFRKLSVDDDPWCQENLGTDPWSFINQEKATASQLCKMYFYFLDDESKAHFKPEKKMVFNEETGEEREEFISRPRQFMKSIDAGSMTEMLLIANAFAQTVVNSRPISDLPETLKKSLLEKANQVPEPGPMGSEVVDLRTEKSQ